jgi:hypothetical protein
MTSQLSTDAVCYTHITRVVDTQYTAHYVAVMGYHCDQVPPDHTFGMPNSAHGSSLPQCIVTNGLDGSCALRSIPESLVVR